MWTKGTYKGCVFYCKHFDNPSAEYGLEGGRISKLEIRKNGAIVYGYDRGEYIPPADTNTEKALDYIATLYN